MGSVIVIPILLLLSLISGYVYSSSCIFDFEEGLGGFDALSTDCDGIPTGNWSFVNTPLGGINRPGDVGKMAITNQPGHVSCMGLKKNLTMNANQTVSVVVYLKNIHNDSLLLAMQLSDPDSPPWIVPAETGTNLDGQWFEFSYEFPVVSVGRYTMVVILLNASDESSEIYIDKITLVDPPWAAEECFN